MNELVTKLLARYILSSTSLTKIKLNAEGGVGEKSLIIEFFM